MFDSPRKILLLGGTAEAREVSEVLATFKNCETVVSLAGITKYPATYAATTRSGGFGGVDGMVDYIRNSKIDLVICATHPYASGIAANAAAAAARTGVPLVAFHREQWAPMEGDRWTNVDDLAGALKALGRRKTRRVFLPLGQKHVRYFEATPRHFYIIRSIEAIDPPLRLPNATYIQCRAPFTRASEFELMRKHQIDVMVLRNSGGTTGYHKISAARELGVELIVLKRPKLPDVPVGKSVAEVVNMVVHELARSEKRVA